MSLGGKPGQPPKESTGQPSQPTRENDTSQPGQPTLDLIPAYSDGEYGYYSRSQVAEFLKITPQNVNDGLSGKSKTKAELLIFYGFEKTDKMPVDAPKNANICRKLGFSKVSTSG